MKYSQFLNTLWLTGIFLVGQASASHGVVIMYHHVGVDRFPQTSVTLDQFDAHLRYLSENNVNVMPLADLVESVRDGRPLPDMSVAITFDDAYRSVYTEAFPRLKALGFPFTVFVNTKPIDSRLGAFLTWEQMREMAAAGASYGNHSLEHAYLIRREQGETAADWDRRVRADLESAQQRLEAELPTVLHYFAYPYGEYSVELANLVAELGLTGFGQQSGAIGPSSDFRWLPRFPLNENYSAVADFAVKISSLPLPLRAVAPQDPVTESDRPTLKVALADTPNLRGKVSCFASSGERMKVHWEEGELAAFRIVASERLPIGRSRYNCTAPAGDGRYYWFSHLWIRSPSTIEPPTP